MSILSIQVLNEGYLGEKIDLYVIAISDKFPCKTREVKAHHTVLSHGCIAHAPPDLWLEGHSGAHNMLIYCTL